MSNSKYSSHLKYLTIILLSIYACQTATPELHEYTLKANHMGTVFQITAIHKNQSIAKNAVQEAYKEVQRIEALISSWDENSETSLINQNAGKQPVKVSDELFELIGRSKKVAVLTHGSFDISFASIDRIWAFDGSMVTIPDSQTVTQSVALINYENIVLNDSLKTVFLTDEGMKIGFGAIGKGYTANRCKSVMQTIGIENGLVNAGGDLICWGQQSSGENWTIGIADPDQKASALSYLNISDMAVVTSGNYERFIEIDGKRYCHIIHPKTGWPVEHLNSVTVLSTDAELADALATAVYVLGKNKGIELIDQLKDTECFIIDENNDIHASKNIDLSFLESSADQ